MTQLIAGRVISGAGSSGMVVMISILITGAMACPGALEMLTCVDLAAPSDVALLRSYTNVVNMIGRGVGAPLGSMMVNSLGWRWYDSPLICVPG